MKSLHKTIWIVLSISFVLAFAASAQETKGVVACAFIMSNCTGSPGMMNCTYQRNVGGGSASCATNMSNNANCSIGMMGSTILTFNAMQTGTNPSCEWTCSACPTVTIDTGSGLPVELLGFDVEDDDVGEQEEPQRDEAEESD